MLSGGSMLAGVCVLRLITASDIAATKAKAEVNPGVPDGQTLSATGGARLDLLDQAQVLTRW
jgi:uncharacterized protein YbjT (DUF2867 family)